MECLKPLRIALTKGRLEKFSIEIFDKIGIDTEELKNKGRKLVLSDKKNNIQFVLVKAADVLTYVEHGAADIGIVGKDTLLEAGIDFYEVVDLKVGKCKFALASIPSFDLNKGYNRKKIATKYPRVTREYFRKLGKDVEIIKIEGSVELAPIIGLSDAIVDIVETGTTLKENGLVIFDEICDISARMIVNRASMKMRIDKIKKIISDVQQVVNN
ncbi:ATP phosphoribosyltransferase [Clostridium akagii]|uniref:ATP phosphoribosyltransferase n=1 Tax=Clostridium akagii TaxID=91623 RepID=UPI00047AFC68|nr:ATP phosphoribosyltransferase [Clostridium akagii]